MKRKAFTLIELLVVIAIISILLGISIPAVKSLTKGNAQKQAVNLMTSMIASAHAAAIQTHGLCGLVIYEEPTNKNQSWVQLVTVAGYGTAGAIRSPGDPVAFMKRLPRTEPQAVPSGVKIATLNSSANFNTEDSANTSRCILFDENGQMVVRNGVGTDPALSTDASAQKWGLKATTGSPSDLANGVSNPGFVIVDSNEYAASPKTTAWLQQHADIVIVNAYTGNVIR